MAETAEAIAFELFRVVAHAENKSIITQGSGSPADRKWVLQTYSECLGVVRDPHLWVKPGNP
jgi:hypothetical protein